MEYILPPNLETMVVSKINISPFSLQSMQYVHSLGEHTADFSRKIDAIREYLGRDYIFTESGRQAIDIILAHCKLNLSDTVSIFTSLGTNYVSSCVTQTIEKYCKWSMKIEKTTKLLLIIHEWGIPHPNIHELCHLGFPVIEDCAYSFASTNELGKVGTLGTYAIYSLPKFFEIDFGGILCGLKPNEGMVLNAKYENYLRAVVTAQLTDLPLIISARVKNWLYLQELFSSVDAPEFFPLHSGIVPSVFMFIPHEKLALELIKKRYHMFNVESSVYYGEHAFYIPCNQNLSEGVLHYLFSIYKNLLDSEVGIIYECGSITRYEKENS